MSKKKISLLNKIKSTILGILQNEEQKNNCLTIEEIQVENPDLMYDTLKNILQKTVDGIEGRKIIAEQCNVEVGPISMDGKAIIKPVGYTGNKSGAIIYFGALRYEDYLHYPNNAGNYNAGAKYIDNGHLFYETLRQVTRGEITEEEARKIIAEKCRVNIRSVYMDGKAIVVDQDGNEVIINFNREEQDELKSMK